MTERKQGLRSIPSKLVRAGTAAISGFAPLTGAVELPDTLPTPPPAQVGELLSDQPTVAGEAARLGLNIPGISPTQQTEAQQTEEEDGFKKEVEGYNNTILNPEGEIDWKDLAEKRQVALFKLITGEYLATAMDLLENDESVQVREVLPEHLETHGITDPKELEMLVEEEITDWPGVFAPVSHRKTPSGRPEIHFIPEDEQGELSQDVVFVLYTPRLVEEFENNEVRIDGFRVRRVILAPFIVPKTE